MSRFTMALVLLLIVAQLASSERAAAADGLVADGAKIEVLADGFTFLEGPAAAPNGDLYFVDLRKNKILHWDGKAKKVITITEDSHGTNGMQFDRKGRLLGCQGGLRRVVAFEPKTAEVVEVLADKFDGKRFNNPNDLWIDPKGGVYFTDPAYSRKKADLELDGRHVYYITPGDKKILKVADDYNTPNGIVGTADGKQLYITDRRLGRTYRYTIQPDGTLADKQLFCKVGADGMTLDDQGNLYTTPRANKLRVFDPSGQELAPIELPTPASNVCFAGDDG
ncbi:MAG: SMP-30/gluconolactonase/LRE family protein, partial [Pirellulales bacterium]|nr:SMP-30/gluconolactonase/LRE family protein [Pirellulales bacterium]